MDEQQVIAEGVPDTEGKFCADCKHLIGVRYKPEAANWNCGHPENDNGMSDADLVTGLKKRMFKHSIYNLRYYPNKNIIPNPCDQAGNWYEKYTPPNYDVVDTIGGEEPVIFDEAAMAAGKEAAAKRLADLRARKNK
jgi:hypothetical protein